MDTTPTNTSEYTLPGLQQKTIHDPVIKEQIQKAIEQREYNNQKLALTKALHETADSRIKTIYDDLHTYCENNENTNTISQKLTYLQHLLIDIITRHYMNTPITLPHKTLIKMCANGYSTLYADYHDHDTYGRYFADDAATYAKNTVLGAMTHALALQAFESHPDIEVLPSSVWMDQQYHTDIALYHAHSKSILLVDIKTSKEYAPVASYHNDDTHYISSLLAERFDKIVNRDHAVTINAVYGIADGFNIHNEGTKYKEKMYATITHNVQHAVEWIIDHFRQELAMIEVNDYQEVV